MVVPIYQDEGGGVKSAVAKKQLPEMGYFFGNEKEINGSLYSYIIIHLQSFVGWS